MPCASMPEPDGWNPKDVNAVEAEPSFSPEAGNAGAVSNRSGIPEDAVLPAVVPLFAESLDARFKISEYGRLAP